MQYKDHKIYKYTNKINGRVYIGRTCRTLESRAGFNGKGYKGCQYFYNAIKKYGWDNFIGEIIEENLTAKDASMREIYWINFYDATAEDKGYNIINDVHFNYTDEFREGSRRAGKKLIGKNNPFYGKHHSEEVKQYYRDLFTGCKHTDETKRKMSLSRKGKYTGELSSMYGKHHSEETRKKMSKSRKNRPSGMLGKHHSEKTKQKLSKSLQSTKLCKKVLCVETETYYKSASEVARLFNYDNSLISRACRSNGSRIVYGFHWRYAE